MLSFIILLIAVAILVQLIILVRLGRIINKEKGILESSESVNADLVLLGSSRCWIQLDAHFFESEFNIKTINLGVNGHGEITMAKVRLQQYLLTNPAPKVALLAFDPTSSGGSESGNTIFFNKHLFAEYAFLPDRNKLPVLNYYRFNNWEKYLPLYAAFKYKLINDCFSFKRTVRGYMATGNELYKEQWDTIAEPVNWKIDKAYFNTTKIDSIKIALKSLDSFCISNHIRLICIQMPFYKNMYDPEPFLATKKICFDLNIPFIDVDREYIRNDIDFFYNSNHLNKKGIVQMNEELKKDTVLSGFLRF